MHGWSLFEHAVRGWLPSIVAIGCIRAWLSFQTGICVSYDTCFSLPADLWWVRPAAIVASGLLVVALPWRPVLVRLRGWLVVASGILGAAAYLLGLIVGDSHEQALLLCSTAMILVFVLLFAIWCEDNVCGDISDILVRLSVSFVAQYIVYAWVMAMPSGVQRVCVVALPLGIAALMFSEPIGRCTATAHVGGRTGSWNAAGNARALAAFIVCSSAAHGFLFRFSEAVTGVWIVGVLTIAAVTLWLTLLGLEGSILRNVLLVALFCQIVGITIMLLFSYGTHMTSLAKSFSYVASMTLASAAGCRIAADRQPGSYPYAYRWLLLYFIGFYAANVLAQFVHPYTAVRLAVMLLLLLVAAAIALLKDWSEFDTASGSVPAGCSPSSAEVEKAARAYGLTQRETDTMRMLLEGRTFKEIAAERTVSVNTVRSQSQSLYRKLGVHGRDELRAAIVRPRLVD